MLPTTRLNPEIRAELRDFLFQLPSFSKLIGRNRWLRETILDTVKYENRLRVAILGDCTTETIAAAVSLAGGSLGLPVQIQEATFDGWRAELGDDTSSLYKFQPHLAVVILTENTFRYSPNSKAESELTQLREDAIQTIDFCRERLEYAGCQEVLFHNLVRPVDDVLGRHRSISETSATSFYRMLNTEINKRDGRMIRLLDISNLAEEIGIIKWRDERFTNIGKYPFSPQVLSEYTLMLRGTLAAIFGQSSKVLVTDLDNTLWSGALDDKGPDGIEFGLGSAIGEAHLNYANYLVKLRESGILLAINSRNDIKWVQEAFRANNDLPLTLEDFSSVHCHWESKSHHMQLIASELNVSVESLVFVDDERFQQDEVRSGTPNVSVVPIGTEPTQFVRRISQLHLFDRLSITDEDKSRANSLRTLRVAGEARNYDLNTFLKSSNMNGFLRKPKITELPRVEQLFAKTNQFNLTGARFNQTELETRLAQVESVVLVGRLSDKFADYGVISALVGRIDIEYLFIENWVVSCRVFSRTFEEFIIDSLLKTATRLGLLGISGNFTASRKNQYAINLLSKHDFLQVDDKKEPWRWTIGIDSSPPHFIHENSSL